MVTDDTIIHICHPNDIFHYLDPNNSGLLDTIVTRVDDDLHSALLGSLNISQPQQHHNYCKTQSYNPSVTQNVGIYKKSIAIESNRPIYSNLACHNKQTVDALSLRMSTMLSNTVYIGTTCHAHSMRKKKLHNIELMNKELHTFRRSMNLSHNNRPLDNDVGVKKKKKKNSIVPLLLREGAILVYNSYHNSGKTTLVQSIATDILMCNSVHVLSAPALFAKYGTSADAALETLLHELAIRCAVVHHQGGSSSTTQQQQQSHSSLGCAAKLCIILDHFETFLPQLSQQAGSGDPYVPVLNAMGELFTFVDMFIPSLYQHLCVS
jgi:hypothetical protein